MINKPQFDSADAEMDQGGMEGDDKEMSEDSGTMGVINRDFCPDAKPGDVIKMKVRKVYNDEIEGEYVGMDSMKGEDEEDMGAEAPMADSPMAGGGGGDSMY